MLVEETFAATPSGFTRLRGSVALSRITADNSGAALSTTNEGFRKDVDLGGPDQIVEETVVASGADANRTVFLWARVGSGSTPAFYAVALNANAGTMTLLRYSTPSAATALGSGTTTVTIPTAPFRFRFEVIGSQLRALTNGIERLAVTDTAITAGNFAGLAFYNCGTATTPALRVDDWRAGLPRDFTPEAGRGLLTRAARA